VNLLFLDTATSGRFDLKDKDPQSPTQAHMIRLATLLTGGGWQHPLRDLLPLRPPL
jgi:hypothetical protein